MSPNTFDVGAVVCDLNRTVHEPARLAILTVLSACDSADFVFLKAATGLTAGNLSVQITRLEEAGFVKVEKVIDRRRTITIVSLTSDGRHELEIYLSAMVRIGQAVRQGENSASDSSSTLPGRVRPQST